MRKEPCPHILDEAVYSELLMNNSKTQISFSAFISGKKKSNYFWWTWSNGNRNRIQIQIFRFLYARVVVVGVNICRASTHLTGDIGSLTSWLPVIYRLYT